LSLVETAWEDVPIDQVHVALLAAEGDQVWRARRRRVQVRDNDGRSAGEIDVRDV
jgi:hypothetical protein